jgi:hypothetical protein
MAGTESTSLFYYSRCALAGTVGRAPRTRSRFCTARTNRRRQAEDIHQTWLNSTQAVAIRPLDQVFGSSPAVCPHNWHLPDMAHKSKASCRKHCRSNTRSACTFLWCAKVVCGNPCAVRSGCVRWCTCRKMTGRGHPCNALLDTAGKCTVLNVSSQKL